ncbi:hypothetical protein ACI76O_11630 [Capnocytophaga cynodegmi]|nr:hypothetical protein [Capnocytophaga cynodegmi]CEN42296.1 hypothetical protein CCYN49044_90020 [Capnocytophaga cynodegmi]
MRWFYNHNGDYYLMEEKGVVLDSTSLDIFYPKDYKLKKYMIKFLKK